MYTLNTHTTPDLLFRRKHGDIHSSRLWIEVKLGLECGSVSIHLSISCRKYSLLTYLLKTLHLG